MKVTVGISNRHLHLSEDDYKFLCGDMKMEVKAPINQIGQFASTLTFTIKTEKSEISNVRLLGPCRKYSQVEISRTDSYKLGLKPPVRRSGDLEESSPITIVGPNGELHLDYGCIIADRHIHMTPEQAQKTGYTDGEKVSVLVDGEKGGRFDNVLVRVAPNSYYEMHIDTDDANAFMISPNQEVEIIKK